MRIAASASRAYRARGRLILTGTRRAPDIVLRYEIDLADRLVPESLHHTTRAR